MKDFELKKATKTPEYGKTLLEKPKARNILASIMAIAIATSLYNASFGVEYAKMGVVAILPIQNQGEFISCVTWKWKGEDMSDLSTNKTIKVGNIEFEADLYDNKRHIAYEWVGARDYDKGNTKKILSAKEIKKIVNYQAPTDKKIWIVSVRSTDKYSIYGDIEVFIDFYERKTEKK